MEHPKSDSSGTDDDLPNQCLIRTPRGILFTGALRIISGPVDCEKESHMDFQIHCIETEAYGAVLKAFIAQSEVLSWGKEELITELRKELRVSDVEHREILGKINLDDSIKSIREWRKGTNCQQLSAKNHSASDSMFVGQLSRKRLKSVQTPVVSSPNYPPRAQPSPVRDGHWNSNEAVFSPQMHGGQAVMPFSQERQAPSSGKVSGPMTMQKSKKSVVHSGCFGNGSMKPGPDIIEIRATDKLIKEVEKICGGVNPDPGQIEKARLVLKEHERALLDAIGKLADVSDGDDSPNRQRQHQYFNDEAEYAGIPCIDLQDDDI